ncbi:tetratricopeptide repeat protein [Streptomyces sp. TRM68416]|uniref:tetratricopeptide repeat protein n=1 Tax=Streptomyces sp. TRM68416 TaxID=2758412 RepID=UPI001661C3F2|nr:tetratricopeptide repeat protein [Streptomyces sp. TRM68416]MBD0841095.1 tetratricopeptide repeat protein [Streptomyces sp. TRM68416]
MTQRPDGIDAAVGRSAGAHYEISGGTYLAPVILGENITLHLPRAITPAMNGLPPRSGTFAGRADALERLMAALAPRPERGDAVVVAVSGLPGVGKTELVLQAADRACREEGWFPGGVLFVDLQGYRSSEADGFLTTHRVLRSFLASLGVSADHLPDDVQDLARIYRSALTAYADRNRRVLVVVDNAASADEVLPLLPGDPRVPVLVTSRHTLSDLSNVALNDLEPLTSEASLDLLREELARKRGPEYGRVEDEPEEAARIAELCGHLPLALQIVAALLADTPERTLASFAGELREAVRPLDGLERESWGVRGAIDLSYAMLPADQARAVRLLWLSVYDSISTEAAARALDATEEETRRLLRALARANLLRNTGSDGDRWSMHDLIAQYADERRVAERASHNDRQSLPRLTRHYLWTASEAHSRLTSQGVSPFLATLATASWAPTATPGATPRFDSPQAALAWLDEERDNLVTTVWLAEYSEEPLLCVGIAVALSSYLDLRHDSESWLRVATAAVDTAEKDGDPDLLANALDVFGNALHAANRPEEAAGVLFRVAELCRELEDPGGEAHALSAAAGALQDLHRHDEAMEAHAAARAAYRRSGATDDDPHLLRRYGSTLRAMGRFDDAIASHDAALAAQRAAGDREGQAVTLSNLANALAESGLHVRAETAYAESIALFREIGHGRGEANALHGLATLLREQQRSTAALDIVEQAREVARVAGDAQQESRALHAMGVILADLDRIDEAFEAQRAARDVARDAADVRREAEALFFISHLLHTTGRPDEAMESAQEALELFRACGDRLREGDALNTLADALDELGDVERCLEARRLAAAVYEEVGEPRLASTLALLGLKLFEERRWAEAVEPLQRAVELYRARGEGAASLLLFLGRALVKEGRYAEAVDILTQAVAGLGELTAAGDKEAASDEGEALLWLGHALERVDRPHERVTAYARATVRFRSLGDRDRKKTALSCLQLARIATGTAGWRGWLEWLRLRLFPGTARKNPARAESLRYRTVVDRRAPTRVLLTAVFLMSAHLLTVPGVPFASRLVTVLLSLALLSGVHGIGRRLWRKQSSEVER